MFPIETSKAGLKRVDYEILEFLEYPRTINQIKIQFPRVNVHMKVLEFLDKGFIQENNDKYVSKFFTKKLESIINQSQLPEDVRKNFKFFLSQIDNPYIRDSIFDSKIKGMCDFLISLATKSMNQELRKDELLRGKRSIDYLMRKLR